MKRSNSLCFLVSMAVSRTARHESTAANDLTRESRRSVNRSRTCAYMFALRSARGTKLAKRFDARDLQTDLKREAMPTAPDHIWVADITYIRLAEELVWSETELQRRANICSYGKDDGKRRKGKCDRVRHSPDDCGP